MNFKLWSSLLACRPLTPMPLPWGEGGRRPGEGSAAWGDPTLAVMRLLATSTVVSDRGEVVGNAAWVAALCPVRATESSPGQGSLATAALGSRRHRYFPSPPRLITCG